MTVRGILRVKKVCLTVFSLVQTVLHPFSKFRVCNLGPILLLFDRRWHLS